MMSDPNHNRCINCQSPNPADAAFCTHCKSELVKPTYDKVAGTLDEMAGNDQTHKTIDQIPTSPGQVISQANAETGPQDQPQPSLFDSNDATESETVNIRWSSVIFAINVVGFTGLLVYFVPVVLAFLPVLFGLVVGFQLMASENAPTGCFSSILQMILVLVMICFMAGLSLFIAFEMICSDMFPIL